MKATAVFQQISARRLVVGVVVAGVTFAALGTVAALWENPIFIRMTPAGGWEIGLLALLAVLGGIYVMIRRPFCTNGTIGAAGVLGFLGVACPICNQILLLAFGSELLLTYYEPARVYVAALGVAVAAWVVVREWRHWESVSGPREASIQTN